MLFKLLINKVFIMNVHYALNLEPVTHDIAKRTLERHLALFE
jgi:hypothetical protein